MRGRRKRGRIIIFYKAFVNFFYSDFAALKDTYALWGRGEGRGLCVLFFVASFFIFFFPPSENAAFKLFDHCQGPVVYLLSSIVASVYLSGLQPVSWQLL